MNSDEFLAAYERHMIHHEKAVWEEITRKEKSWWGRLKRWWYSRYV